MADLITYILELYLDIKHWFQVKKRRKFEKENNLPKSVVWHPMTKPLIVTFLVCVVSFFVFLSLTLRDKSKEKTKEKLNVISILLEAEKKQFGKYPVSLKIIVRNNPLRKNIILDDWKNEFFYTVSEDLLNYTIISLGNDGVLNTSDDIKITNYDTF